VVVSDEGRWKFQRDGKGIATFNKSVGVDPANVEFPTLDHFKQLITYKFMSTIGTGFVAVDNSWSLLGSYFSENFDGVFLD